MVQVKPTSIFSSLDQGFHSNDALGTTVTTHAIDESLLTPVPPLVESFGGEIGLRSVWHEKANISVALWFLDLDSELILLVMQVILNRAEKVGVKA